MAKQAPFGAFVSRPVGGQHARRAKGTEPAVGIDEAWPADLVEVGWVVEAYGVRGWVKIQPHARDGQSGEALSSARRWWLERGPERRMVSVEQTKRHGGDMCVALFAGCGDRDAAEALKGGRVYVRRADFQTLGENEFYWVDLIGSDVLNRAGVPLGKVADLIDNGVHAVLRVVYPTSDAQGAPAEGERLIPFVEAYLVDVDVAQRRIVVDWELDY